MFISRVIDSTAIGPSSRSFCAAPGIAWAVPGPPRSKTVQLPAYRRPCMAQAEPKMRGEWVDGTLYYPPV